MSVVVTIVCHLVILCNYGELFGKVDFLRNEGTSLQPDAICYLLYEQSDAILRVPDLFPAAGCLLM